MNEGKPFENRVENASSKNLIGPKYLQEKALEISTSEESNVLDVEISKSQEKVRETLNSVKIEIDDLYRHLMSLSANGKRIKKYPDNEEYSQQVEISKKAIEKISKELKSDIANLSGLLDLG